MVVRSLLDPVIRALAALALAFGLPALAWPAAAAGAADDEAPSAVVAIAHDDDDDDDEPDEDDDGGDDSEGSGDAGDARDEREALRRAPREPSAPAPPVAAPAPVTPAVPGPVRPTPPIAARHLVRPGLLTPVRGRVLGGLQPTLRWRHHGRGIRLYNVQVFTAGKKVMSIFPRGRSFRVAPGRLAPGRRYVWRVWPFRERGGFTAKPLAVSWFATPSRAALSRRR